MDSAREVKAVQVEVAKQEASLKNKMTPEFIRSITPILFGGIGLVIGVVALWMPTNEKNDAKWSAAFGLAGTAIAGGAGLAQSRPEGNNGNPKL